MNTTYFESYVKYTAPTEQYPFVIDLVKFAAMMKKNNISAPANVNDLEVIVRTEGRYNSDEVREDIAGMLGFVPGRITVIADIY